MPSALETLVKILKLEREQGCENRAVIGGLAAYGANWKQQAQEQARRAEHHVLAEELTDLLQDYEQIDGQLDRIKQIDYMLDRIVGREPIPEKYQGFMKDFVAPAPQKKERKERIKKYIKGTIPVFLENRLKNSSAKEKADFWDLIANSSQDTGYYDINEVQANLK